MLTSPRRKEGKEKEKEKERKDQPSCPLRRTRHPLPLPGRFPAPHPHFPKEGRCRSAPQVTGSGMWDGVARGLGEAPAGMVQAWAHWRFYFRRAKAQGFPRTPPGSPAAPRAPPPVRGTGHAPSGPRAPAWARCTRRARVGA